MAMTHEKNLVKRAFGKVHKFPVSRSATVIVREDISQLMMGALSDRAIGGDTSAAGVACWMNGESDMSRKKAVSLLVASVVAIAALCFVCVGMWFGWFISLLSCSVVLMLAISASGVIRTMVSLRVGLSLGLLLFVIGGGVVAYVFLTYGWLSVFGFLFGLTLLVISCRGVEENGYEQSDSDDFSSLAYSNWRAKN